jgi:hypothetical protein
MRKPKSRASVLDYASGESTVLPKIRWGVISLFLSILAAVVGAIALLAASLLNAESIFMAAALLSLRGVSSGIGGLFQPGRRRAAEVGMVLSILDFFLIGILMPA